MQTELLKVQTECMTKDRAVRPFPRVGGWYSTENYTSLSRNVAGKTDKNMNHGMTE